MAKVIMKPQLLIVTEEEITYGVEHGYYPEFFPAIQCGSLAIVSREEIVKDNKRKNPKYRLDRSEMPVGNGQDFYMWNQYSNIYRSIWNQDILNILVSDKSFAVKEILVRMGAKDVVLMDDVAQSDKKDVVAKNTADLKIGKGNVEVKYNNVSTQNIKSKIESHNPNNTPRSPQIVEELMEKYGLAYDSYLEKLLERLKVDGKLEGTERYTITYSNEIKSALNIAAQINYQLFDDDLDFSQEHTFVRTISKTIDINFG